MAATAMEHDGGAEVVVTPGELLGPSSSLAAGRGAYAEGRSVRASVTGRRRFVPPAPGSSDQRSTVEVVGHKAHGAVPQPGSIVIARVTKVMARMASADIMCVDSKAVKEKFTGMIRQQDVRATEIDKVDMYQSYRPGDIVRALVLSLGDARAYYLSTAKNELGVVSAQSIAGGTLVPTSWTEMQCELTGQIEQRKVAKVE
ncbi:exosome complex component CSL4 [Hordeum vulgare subsp. vulgare]|uniref:Exosome complex component CSL4 C-terminal domain-containing protein n=1 Tax=Hordeum vulgare subsp. vulgare TaxID=112509 RepID=A0A8I6YBR0_HORVV|nr:exosome complex component CSL4 [Hordeum vulgare subsp. vulgare]